MFQIIQIIYYLISVAKSDMYKREEKIFTNKFRRSVEIVINRKKYFDRNSLI